MGDTLTPAALEDAKATYKAALDTLMAHQRAEELAAGQALVGRFFKHVEALRDDPDTTWLVYLVVTSLDAERGRLTGWHFQQVPTGQAEVAPDVDLRPAFITEQCIEIARVEFVVAFNELLTAIARFAHRIPTKG
jgi:hypothetical protein